MNVTKNRQKAIRILSYISIFLFSGIVYYLIEIAYRGYSHWTMFVLSGIAGVLICQINNFFTYDMDYLLQLLLSTTIITTLEYIFGIIFNSDYSIWNYSNLPFNYKGQICLYFVICNIYSNIRLYRMENISL